MTEKTSRVERGGEGNHAETARTSVGGLYTGNAGKGRRFTDGAARVGCRGNRSKARSHAACGTAGTAARHSLWIPGVENLTVGRIFVGRAHCEFIAVEFAEGHHTAFSELTDNCGIKGAHVALEHFACRGRRPVTRHKNILVRNRNTGQTSGLSFGNALIGGLRLRERHFRTHVQKTVQVFMRFNPFQIGLGKFNGTHLFGLKRTGKLNNGAEFHIIHEFFLRPLFHNTGHQEEPFIFFGGIFHVFLPIVAEDHAVFSETLHAVMRVHHRLHPFRIDRLNAFDHLKNIVEFPLHLHGLLLRNINVSKLSNAADVIQSKGHVRTCVTSNV